MSQTRRLAAILAADVAGYSRLMGADEEGTLERLKAVRRELVDPKIAEHRGRIVKTTGDGVLVEFASVGVNIAARTEALADPGGVFVSGTVYDHVRDRLPFLFEDLGEQQVKNIARPVRVYRVCDAAAVKSTSTQPSLPLPDKPSIDAREIVRRLRKITPVVVPRVVPFRNPQHRELFLSGLRLAAGETA